MADRCLAYACHMQLLRQPADHSGPVAFLCHQSCLQKLSQLWNSFTGARHNHPGEDEAKFLPVEVIAQPTPSEPVPEPTGLIELELANGHRLRISGSYTDVNLGSFTQLATALKVTRRDLRLWIDNVT